MFKQLELYWTTESCFGRTDVFARGSNNMDDAALAVLQKLDNIHMVEELRELHDCKNTSELSSAGSEDDLFAYFGH